MIFELPNKIIISGKSVEVFSYEKTFSKNLLLNRKNYAKRTYRYNNISNHKDRMLRSKNSLRRSRMSIIRLVNANPDFTKFITLTFKNNISDLNKANYEFNKFIQRLRYFNKRHFKYIAIPEFQKRGAVHYHLICNLDYIHKTDLSSIWSHGFVRVKEIRDMQNIGLYVSKYLKNSNDSRLFGRRCFFSSQKINHPLVYTLSVNQGISNLRNTWENLELDNVRPFYQKIYDSKYHGKITYRQYKLL